MPALHSDFHFAGSHLCLPVRHELIKHAAFVVEVIIIAPAGREKPRTFKTVVVVLKTFPLAL